MHGRNQAMWTGFVVVGALALSACGSSSSQSSSSAPSATTGSSSASTPSAGSSSTSTAGAPIIVGNVGTYSGPIGSSNTAAVPVLQAWAAQVNGSGGINGHQIKIVSADDKTSPSDNLTATQDQVENQHVIAFVSNMQEATAGAAQSYLEGKSVPVVGGDGNLPAWYESPMYFPTGPSPAVINYAQMKNTVDVGVKKLSIWYCTDSPTCKVFADQQTTSAKAIGGLTLTGEQPISLAQASFTAPCLAAKNAGADAVTPNVDTSTFQRIVKSCQSVGYNPIYTTSTNSIDSSFSSLPGGVVADGVTAEFPYFLTSASAAYASVFKGLSGTEQNASAAQAWSAAQLFEAAAKVGIPAGGTPTSAEILKGLYQIKNNTLGGLTIPLTFTEGKPAPAGNCWFTTDFSTGKFTSPSGLKTVCTDATIPS